MYVGRPVGLHIVSGVGRPAVPVFGGVSIIDTFFICFVFAHKWQLLRSYCPVFRTPWDQSRTFL
jgi:hypothetical protein